MSHTPSHPPPQPPPAPPPPPPLPQHVSSDTQWFSVYVPWTSGSAQRESYLRLGSPDTTTEAQFLATLQASYADATAEPAVRAAFGGTPTSGAVIYTRGDLVQFVHGRCDTRVLDDSFVAHVLNKSDVDAGGPKTHRAYLRLGKPNRDIEDPLSSLPLADDIVTLVRELVLAAPAADAMDATVAAQNRETTLAGPVEAVLGARSSLVAAARANATAAIDALEALRTSADARAATDYDGKNAKKWGLSELRKLHDFFATSWKGRILGGEAAARTKFEARAATDPVVRGKLLELAESTTPGALQGTPATNAWAKGVLDGLATGREMEARFSLGDGIALYADKAVTLTTPSALKMTVGSDSRTVLGPSYNETYSVSDDVIQKIKDGVITQVEQIDDKRLITASLTQRDLLGLTWRTVKFDQAKALSYSVSDGGSFAVSSSYAFGAGFKFGNSISGSFDSTLGVSVSVPLSLFKVECGSKGYVETSWPFGKVNYQHSQDLKGTTVQLSVQAAKDVVAVPAKIFNGVMRVGMGVIHAAVLTYTAAGLIIGQLKTGEGEDASQPMKNYLVIGEGFYTAITVLNAVFMAAGIVVGVIQLVTRKTVDFASTSAPATPPNILMNAAGIKLQCGASYIHLDNTGIAIYGPTVYVAGPMTTVVPSYITSPTTPTQIAQSIAEIDELFGEGFMDALAAV